MYPISSAVKALFDAENRQTLRITGTDKNGVPITITEKNVMEGCFTVDRYVCNGDRLEIGTAISSELTMKLDNRYGTFSSTRFEGTELFVEIGIADWTQENPTIHYVPCGYFTPDEQPRALSTISINALDRMMLFDQELGPQGAASNWVDASGNYIVDEDSNDIVFYPPVSYFPCTVASLVQQCCDLFGVTLGDDLTGKPNSTYVVNSIPESNEPVTYRNLIQWCAGLMGTNAFIDWEGKLRFTWYDNESGYVTTVANRFSSSMFENDVSISGIKYTDENNEVHLSGSDQYALDLSGNLLIDSTTADAVLLNLYTALHAFTYRPFTATVTSAPYLWPMDRVVFKDKDNVSHVSSLTNVNITVNGTTAIAGNGETDQVNSYAKPGAFTGRQSQALQEIQTVMNNHLNEAVESATSMITGANGGHIRFIYDSNDDLSEIVIMDTTDVDTAVKVWRWNQGGLGFSSNGYDGPYTLAMTQNGAIVANFITTGTLDALQASVINLNASNIIAGTIDGDNVNAKKFSVVDANDNVVATFDAILTLGDQSDSYLKIDKRSMQFFGSSTSDPIVTFGDARDSTTNTADITDTFVGNGITNVFTLSQHFVSVYDVTLDGNTVDPQDYTIGASGTVYVLSFSALNPPGANVIIQVKYATDDPIVHFNTCEMTTLLLEPPGNWSFNSGSLNSACGKYSHAEGSSTEALGINSHAEGKNTKAHAASSHTEGVDTRATTPTSHAEGYNTNTDYDFNATTLNETMGGNHAEGNSTSAGGYYGSHAEGWGTTTAGRAAHAEGKDTEALHDYSHAQGLGTITGAANQFVFGTYNIDLDNNYIEVVGGGTQNSRQNLRELKTNGDMWIKGTLTQGSDARLKTEQGKVPDVSSVRAKAYKWNDNRDGDVHIGYYAQDVEKVAPYLVSTNNATGLKSLDYIGFLCAKVECLEQHVAALEARIEKLIGGDV